MMLYHHWAFQHITWMRHVVLEGNNKNRRELQSINRCEDMNEGSEMGHG